MPVELIHVDADDLAGLNIERALLSEFRPYLDHDPTELESLAILAPPEAGSRELLMVLARRVGASLRDENIRLRDRGGDLRAQRKKLCYIPGIALPEAFRDPAARRALEREAAVFFQELETAWQAKRADSSSLVPGSFLALLDARAARGLSTFLSADPRALPPCLGPGIRARMRVLEPA